MVAELEAGDEECVWAVARVELVGTLSVEEAQRARLGRFLGEMREEGDESRVRRRVYVSIQPFMSRNRSKNTRPLRPGPLFPCRT